MKAGFLRALFVALVALPVAAAFAQVGPRPGGGGGGGVAASGTPSANQEAVWTGSSTVKGVDQGVFNVRRLYGAVPDGSTDNSTAITTAFTASNAWTGTPNSGASRVPVIYFDCDVGTTTCKYNYGGTGASPINPTVPTTIMCSPGATLNYTGTAHAADIGPTGLVAQATLGQYKILGCQWTGGASYTAGIYVNNYLENLTIQDNSFINFGSVTAYSIVIPGQNYRMTIRNNKWIDTDGTARSMLDNHLATNPDLEFTGNKTSCLNSASSTFCAVTSGNIGVGLWVSEQAVITGNEITFHQPAVRISALNGQVAKITNNWFEGNTGVLGPAITFGDPGGTASNALFAVIRDNFFYWPSAANVPFIGPETPASGNYVLNNSVIVGNMMSPAPTGTAVYVNTNDGNGNYYGQNHGPTPAVPLNQASSPTLADAASMTSPGANATLQAMDAVIGNGGALASSIAMFDSTGSHLVRAPYSVLSTGMLCTNSNGSATAPNCAPTGAPFNVAGTFYAPTAGSILVLKTNAANTSSSYTLSIQGNGSVTVKKYQGTVLVAGDITTTGYNILVYDGTFWELQNPPNGAQALSGTTASIGGSALSASCASGAVSIAGVTSTMAVAVSPAADITGGGAVAFSVFAAPGAGSVTVYVCGTGTPAATTYNVRALL